MTINLSTNTYYRPFFQALVAPVKLIYALFLKTIGSLLSCFGVLDWGKKLSKRAAQIDSSTTNLFVGLWAFGRRFLVHSDNSESSCRGSCYWMIDQHLKNPQIPLAELTKAFEGGAPKEAIAIHRSAQIPIDLNEEKIWSMRTGGEWPDMPKLQPGIYTFLIGYNENENKIGKAHRVAFFKQADALLFDPNTGLSEWSDLDWKPLLERTAREIQMGPNGFFTIECYSYQ